MNVECKVHSVTQGPAKVKSTVEGVEMYSDVDCIEVVLTPVKTRHGTMTLRFIGDERAEAADLFTPGKEVTLSIA